MIGNTLSTRQKIFLTLFVYFVLIIGFVTLIYLNPSKPTFIASLVFLIISGALTVQTLYKIFSKPFRQIEDIIKGIADGQSEPIFIESHDREIKSIDDSLKKMSLYLSNELEIRQKQLMHTEKLASLGTFLSGIAHELNNPLSNVYSSCQILKEEIEETDMEYKKELLEQIEKESNRARNIARSLLAFTREGDFKKEFLLLKDLFEETIRFIHGHKPKDVKLILNIPDEIKIFVDKQRIQQAFLNLIKNSLEAIQNEGSITISAKEKQAKDTVDIEIRDTGIGMDAETLSKVFGAFFTTKDVGKGSGLGLFITKEIIKEHGGSIQVESQLGKGSAFIIKLPCREF